MPFFTPTPALADLIGVAGFGLYVAAYGLLTLRVIGGNSALYMALNLLASSCVLLSLTASFNLASALTQIFWIALSLVGLALHLRRRSVLL